MQSQARNRTECYSRAQVLISLVEKNEKKCFEILFLQDSNSIAILLPTSMNLNKFKFCVKPLFLTKLANVFFMTVIQFRCKLHMHIVILRWWYSGVYLMIFIAKQFFYYHGYYLSIDFHIWNTILLC